MDREWVIQHCFTLHLTCSKKVSNMINVCAAYQTWLNEQQKVGDIPLSEDWKRLSTNFIQLLIGSKWHFLSVCVWTLHLVPKQQIVNSSPFQSLFTSNCKTNRMYVILLWDINSSYEILWQKRVCGIIFLCPNSCCKFHSKRKWVSMLVTLLLQLFCSTDCEWCCKFCEKQWNHKCSGKCRRLAACHASLLFQKLTMTKFCLWPTVCE